MVSFTLRPLYTHGKIPSYPLDSRLSGPHSRSGRAGEQKISQHLPGLEPPIIQPVAQRCTAELTRLPNGITSARILKFDVSCLRGLISGRHMEIFLCYHVHTDCVVCPCSCPTNSSVKRCGALP
jgi:hypothetical protein